MNMNKALAVAAIFTLGSAQAFAQAKNFEGLSIGANYESTHTNLNTVGAQDSGGSSGLGLQAQYTFAMSPTFTIGVGATYSTANHVAATTAGAYADNVYTNTNISVDFLPGYALSDTTLVYGKLSALSGTLQDNKNALSYSLGGVGYGIGLRSMVDKSIYFQLGFDFNTYSDVNTQFGGGATTIKSDVYSIGVGYKF